MRVRNCIESRLNQTNWRTSTRAAYIYMHIYSRSGQPRQLQEKDSVADAGFSVLEVQRFGTRPEGTDGGIVTSSDTCNTKASMRKAFTHVHVEAKWGV